MSAFLVPTSQPGLRGRPGAFDVSVAKLYQAPPQAEALPNMTSTDKLLIGLTAGVTMGMSARTLRLRRRVGEQVVLVQTPPQTYQTLAEKGETNGNMSALKTLHSSVMGGCYVGMSGLLSLVIAGNLSPGNLTAQVFVFAALFPINLLLVLQSGGQLFTGNTATMSMAYFENKVTVRQIIRNWLISYAGNIIGCCSLAFVAYYLGLFTAGTQEMATRVALKKCSATFGQTLVKGMMCNWLVCMAVWLSTSAQDLASKMVGIWFPISMFIMIGFEHSVANLFMLPAGLLAGAPISVADVILKNLIPVTIGNAISGTIIIGAGFSFAFGKLGAGSAGSFTGIAKKMTGK